ncbi:MAG: pyrroline-5-carboxylate reductase [Candidatus Undinarchaeales archaeon]
MDKKIGIIGIGNMGEVLLKYILDFGITEAEKVYISDRKKSKLEDLKEELGVNISLDNKETAKNSDVLILAVRPQVLEEVLLEIKPKIKNQLIISIAAGVKTELIENIFKGNSVVRVMPNILYKVGKGAAAFSLGKNADEADEKLVKEIFGAGGICLKLDESKINFATPIVGSSPAFIQYLVNALIEASEKQTFSREKAEETIIQIAEGTIKVIKEGKANNDVATKGGATIEGLKVLNEYKVKEALTECLDKTREKAEKLG